MSETTHQFRAETCKLLNILTHSLYTNHEIFLRELLSNASDALEKVRFLQTTGAAVRDAELPLEIRISSDKENHVLTIADTGVGMSEQDLIDNLGTIARSGSEQFLRERAAEQGDASKVAELVDDKLPGDDGEEPIVEHDDSKADDAAQIIGRFGIGFYSVFMIADKVTIDTLSFREGATAVRWESEDGMAFTMTEGQRTTRGTTITLHVSEEEAEFLEVWRVREVLERYCSFMAYPIYLKEIKDEDVKVSGEGEEETEKTETPINDVAPLYVKAPQDCTDEDYKAFYRKVFHEYDDPLFWIHLNMDYPFRLKGILYFPKLTDQFDMRDGEVKLYCNQVYIADNVKEVVPEFLLLLKGILDCPDMPLNVSRSALQNDGYVEKMNAYITKKVADKLNQLFKNDRTAFEGFWDDINIFIKYGCMREEKLYDKVKDALLLKTTDGVYETVSEYLEKNKEKHENVIYFANDVNQQAQYIRLFQEQGLEAAILDTPVDKPFVSFLEYKNQDIKLKVQRVDADIDSLQEKSAEEESEAKKQAAEFEKNQMQDLFRAVVSNDKLTVKLESLKAEKVSAMILLSEESRRMMEMMEAYANNEEFKAMFAGMKPDETLVLNKNNKLVKTLLSMAGKEEKKEDANLLSRQMYDLALMSHRPLNSDEMTAFIDRSNMLLERLAELEK